MRKFVIAILLGFMVLWGYIWLFDIEPNRNFWSGYWGGLLIIFTLRIYDYINDRLD